MTPFEAYKVYLSIKMHFTSKSYDYFKYEGRVSASEAAFHKRKDRYFFTKLAKLKNPRDVVLANMILSPKMWVGKIVDVSGIAVYQDWQKRNESISYFTMKDSEKLYDDFDKNFEIDDEEQHPHILKKYLTNEISLETLIILLDISDKLEYIDSKLQSDIIWGEIKTLCEKYKPFMQYDKEKIQNMLFDKIFVNNF